MIFVDFSNYRPSKMWRKKAKKQLNQLAAIHSTGNIAIRNLRIDGRQYVWSEIKSQIIKVTINKCWFSEGTNDVAHFHIEHFRPKKLVEILPAKYSCQEQRSTSEPNSYWWLAFNFKNFRICGQIVNSYKGNYFPLKTGSLACNTPRSDISSELVILLDPTIKSDTDLLTFDINGMPIPSADPVLNPDEYSRADISIKVYGLKDGIIHDARKRKLADLNILINKINHYYILLKADPTNSAVQEVIKIECSMLIAMTHKNQPFSKMVQVNLGYIPYQWAVDYIFPFLKD